MYGHFRCSRTLCRSVLGAQKCFCWPSDLERPRNASQSRVIVGRTPHEKLCFRMEEIWKRGAKTVSCFQRSQDYQTYWTVVYHFSLYTCRVRLAADSTFYPLTDYCAIFTPELSQRARGTLPTTTGIGSILVFQFWMDTISESSTRTLSFFF